MPIDATTLSKNPNRFEIVSVRSGHSVTLTDDGAAINNDGTFPNGQRQHALAQAGKRHGHGGKNGPKIPSWVTKQRLERSNGNPILDPANQFRHVDDDSGIVDDSGKRLTFGDIIAINVAAEKARAPEDLRLVANEARARGASEQFLEGVNKLIDQRLSDIAAAAPATSKKG
jgi:hypothetical protein